jgi:hypothetical protein
MVEPRQFGEGITEQFSLCSNGNLAWNDHLNIQNLRKFGEELPPEYSKFTRQNLQLGEEATDWSRRY